MARPPKRVQNRRLRVKSLPSKKAMPPKKAKKARAKKEKKMGRSMEKIPISEGMRMKL